MCRRLHGVRPYPLVTDNNVAQLVDMKRYIIIVSLAVNMGLLLLATRTGGTIG